MFVPMASTTSGPVIPDGLMFYMRRLPSGNCLQDANISGLKTHSKEKPDTTLRCIVFAEVETAVVLSDVHSYLEQLRQVEGHDHTKPDRKYGNNVPGWNRTSQVGVGAPRPKFL